MGNLICCAGENHNKRGGTNVKTLLRKTEKPGKRRRIDDLVRDVLKKERREDRQNRKREKKEANRPRQERGISTDVDIEEPSKVQNEKKEEIPSADEVEEHILGSMNEATSSTSVGEEGCVEEDNSQDLDQSDLSSSSVKDAKEQPSGCTYALILDPISDVGINSDSVNDPTNESTQAKKDETEGRGESTYETECGVTIGSDNEATSDEHVPEEDSERKTPDSDTTNVDDETEHISRIDLYEVCEGLRADAATDERGDMNNEKGLHNKETVNNDYVQTRDQDDARFTEGENLNDDNKAVDILRVHDTDNLSRCDEDVTMTNNDDSQHTVNILKVHDTDNLPVPDYVKTTNEDSTVDILKVHDTDSEHGYDNTELRRNMEEDRAPLCENTALEPISRSNQMGLKQWGSLIDLRDIKKFSFASMLKVVGVYKKQMIHKLRPVNTLSKARAIGYSSAKKHLTKQSTTKHMYGVRNCTMNGGQKPHIKAIERLKKDTYNFPPKFRQFTEEDKHGSLADLKWSRHMRAEARRHIGMESFEFEELKFLTNVASTDDDEFDVCDVPRASTPVPGTRPQNY